MTKKTCGGFEKNQWTKTTDSAPSVVSMSPTSFQALGQTTGHRFNERRSLVWTQSSPLVVQDLAEIVGRDNVIPTRDAPFDLRPQMFSMGCRSGEFAL